MYPTKEEKEKYLDGIAKDIKKIKASMSGWKELQEKLEEQIKETISYIDYKYQQKPSLINQVEIESLRQQVVIHRMQKLMYVQFSCLEQDKLEILKRAQEYLNAHVEKA